MTIRNDATRPEAALADGRRPRSVITRQGQVLLDIDLNSAGAIAAERVEVEARDTLGALAAPFAEGGFIIGAGGTISAGRLYVDGLIAENVAATTLADQPHPADPLPAGPALVAIKALVRLVDPSEDRRLTDKALGDAVGSGRALVDWQVFALELAGAVTASCGAASPDWDKIVAPSSGRLSARVDPGIAATSFCTPAARGGFSRLENLLYRLEVEGGTAVAGYPVVDGPRFGLDGLRLKLSRRNASVMTRITGYTGRELTVDPPALDAAQWFAAGGVAEIASIHDDVDPRAAAGVTRLYGVARAEDDRVTLTGAGALPLPAASALGITWSLRLWDTFPGFAIDAVASGGAISAEIDCGDGVLVTLHEAASGDTLFRRGDWWSFTARVDGSIDWPESGPGTPAPRPPDGPAIHYARLAAVDGPAAVPVDCRPVFLPLTLQHILLYRGGDGQAACLTDDPAAFVPLRAKLRVAAMRGGLPVAGLQVRWSTPPGLPAAEVDGAATPMTTTTDAEGLTEVVWALDRTQPDVAHAMVAELVGPPGPPVAPVLFSACFTTAARTSYVPGCALLSAATTVQEALDTLCAATGPATAKTLSLRQIKLQASGRALIDDSGLILNGLEFEPAELVRGLLVEVDGGPLAAQVDPDDPIVDLEIEMPYPITSTDADFWGRVAGSFGTVRLRLDGSVKMAERSLEFVLSSAASRFLMWINEHPSGAFPRKRYCARLRLRSQWIWAETENGQIYLNAEHLGVTGPTTKRELTLKEANSQRAGDLDMFFYLVPRVQPG